MKLAENVYIVTTNTHTKQKQTHTDTQLHTQTQTQTHTSLWSKEEVHCTMSVWICNWWIMLRMYDVEKCESVSERTLLWKDACCLNKCRTFMCLAKNKQTNKKHSLDFLCNAEFIPCWALPDYIRALIHLARLRVFSVTPWVIVYRLYRVRGQGQSDQFKKIT